MGLLEDLYRETLLEHYQHPRNFGPLLEATLSVGAQNPSCGDRIRLHLQLEGERIRAIRFEGEGCALSIASASMMTLAVEGKLREEALALSHAFRTMVTEGQLLPDLGDLQAFFGVSRLHARVKCATLPWATLEEALANAL
jgi:nitrogen fixation NifU-like protein